MLILEIELVIAGILFVAVSGSWAWMYWRNRRSNPEEWRAAFQRGEARLFFWCMIAFFGWAFILILTAMAKSLFEMMWHLQNQPN
jgi:hypothetical protein